MFISVARFETVGKYCGVNISGEGRLQVRGHSILLSFCKEVENRKNEVIW